ncbi:unnamed protein product [Gadus morhua 'NCC']
MHRAQGPRRAATSQQPPGYQTSSTHVKVAKVLASFRVKACGPTLPLGLRPHAAMADGKGEWPAVMEGGELSSSTVVVNNVTVGDYSQPSS